jgi:hypothetical protein
MSPERAGYYSVISWHILTRRFAFGTPCDYDASQFADAVKYRLSSHAQAEIGRRQIPLAVVEAIIESPDQIVPERGVVRAYQSKRDIGGKMFLVRVMVDDSIDPAVVVTAYRTTKIDRYWRKP